MAMIIGAMTQEELEKVNKAGYVAVIVDRKTAGFTYGYDIYGQWEEEEFACEQVVCVHIDCDVTDLLDFSEK